MIEYAPFLASLRDDARYATLVRKMGLPYKPQPAMAP